MAFELDPADASTSWILVTLHVVSVMAGIVAIWFGADPVVKWCMRQPWFVWAAAFSFIIFGLHVPMLQYLTNLMFLYLHDYTYHRLLTYLLAPAITLAFCIAVGSVFRALLPREYRVATGGRGF